VLHGDGHGARVDLRAADAEPGHRRRRYHHAVSAGRRPQIFAVPERPMGPLRGVPAKLPVRLAIPVKITELMVEFEVTGREAVTGPRSLAPMVRVDRCVPALTVATPPPAAVRPGNVAAGTSNPGVGEGASARLLRTQGGCENA
jgi:hypothetical protein